jgi:hypothetical protein
LGGSIGNMSNRDLTRANCLSEEMRYGCDCPDSREHGVHEAASPIIVIVVDFTLGRLLLWGISDPLENLRG